MIVPGLEQREDNPEGYRLVWCDAEDWFHNHLRQAMRMSALMIEATARHHALHGFDGGEVFQGELCSAGGPEARGTFRRRSGPARTDGSLSANPDGSLMPLWPFGVVQWWRSIIAFFFLLRPGKSSSASAGRTTPSSSERFGAERARTRMPRSTPRSRRAVSFASIPRGAAPSACAARMRLLKKASISPNCLAMIAPSSPLVGSNLKRGIDEETSFALPIIDRVVDDFGKEPVDSLFRR